MWKRYSISNNLQVYLVTGGMGHGEWYGYAMASTETLVKKGGTAWQYARDLPKVTVGMSGVALDNGHFIIVGQYNCLRSTPVSPNFVCSSVSQFVVMLKSME